MVFPASSKGGGFTVAFPDVCKTPGPVSPIPIPYPNVAKTAHEKKAKKVKIGGKTPGLTNKSAYKKSTGDEAATRSFGAGVVSHKINSSATVNAAAQAKVEAQSLKGMMNTLNQRIQALPADRPDQWQAALQEYAVAASALFMTISPDD